MTDETAKLTLGDKALDYNIIEGAVGPKVIDIRKLYAQTGAFTYDPGFTSTAACESAITYIDGDEGILLHRGYPIGQLAEQSSFMEVSYLLLNGELPTADELDKFTYARNVELYTETRRAEAERARADKVLYNVLPAVIADELKRDGKVKAVKFENMGVLFADIAGFTSFSRALPPDALVLVLNDIFSSFDELVERNGVEKIKTIGDAYMVVSDQRLDSLAQLALDMGDALRRYNRVNGTKLGMRIGIHAGPAVAGVIGVKRFLYDVWGDTVNVASRMESTGATGAIQVTEAVHRQIRGQFEFRAREALDIKGSGPMATYWLLGPVAPVASADARRAAALPSSGADRRDHSR